MASNRKGAEVAIEGSLEVPAPVESVFELVSDPRNDVRWCPRVAWCEQRAGEGPAPGARYEAFHRPTFQRPHRRRIEVVELDPPLRMRSIQEDDLGRFDITYVLEATPSGTRITQKDRIEWKIARLNVPIANLIVRRHIGDQLRRLARVLESDSARAVAGLPVA